MLRQMARAFGLILGYAAMSLALRLADAIAVEATRPTSMVEEP